MAVNKLQLIIVCLMAILFVPIIVDATCNQCKNSHACINETSFQICFNDVRNQTITFTCPSDKPICTDYNSICMENATNVIRGCGEVSKCSVCAVGDLFACTSLNTFGRCNEGEITSGRATCANNNVCSASGAALNENICVSPCDIDDSDVCDRVEEIDSSPTESPSTDTPSTTTVTDSPTPSTTTVTDSPTPSTTTVTDSPTTSTTTVTDSPTTSTTTVTDSPTTSTTIVTDSPTTSTTTVTDSPTTSTTTVTDSPTTTTTTATPNTPITPTEYCAVQQIAGRYAIPNDTECTSYILCFAKSIGWQGVTYNCTVSKPYFSTNATICGTTKPTGINCTN